MTKEKKRIGFYPLLAVGHFNVCLTIGRVLLDRFGDELEVYFLTDEFFAEKIIKVDARFKLAKIEYDGQKDESRFNDVVLKLESFLELPQMERLLKSMDVFINDPTDEQIDIAAEKLIRELKLDFLLCDQFGHQGSMSLVPCGFIVSTNPSLFDLENYPRFGSDAGVDDKQAIEKFKGDFGECRRKCRRKWEAEMRRRHEARGLKFDKKNLRIDVPIGEHFSVYTYPLELDFVPEAAKLEHSLWRIDSAILPQSLPAPFELPDQLKNQAGELIYVSMGSLFSVFTERFQRIINMLDRLPYRYIVSLGPKGEQIKLPSGKFWGANYVQQLAVLQNPDCKLIISHGGNNTVCECFYFGVKSIVIPVHGDQVNNGKRLEETGFGYQLDLNSLDETKLSDAIERALKDDKMAEKLSKASERIKRVQNEELATVCERIVDHINKL